MTVSEASTLIARSDKPPRRRRRVPLSLQIFAAFLVLLCTGVAIFVGIPAYRQQRAIRQFSLVDASFHFRSAPNGWLYDRIAEARWLGESRLSWIALVTEVDLRSTTAGPEVNHVLANLKALNGVRRLNLSSTQVNDSGMAYLEGLSELQEINLRETMITDAGLTHLSQLITLRRVKLLGTGISDAGLVHLRGLTNLRELNVIQTRVTASGVKELKSALPMLKVVVDSEFEAFQEVPEPASARPADGSDLSDSRP